MYFREEDKVNSKGQEKGKRDRKENKANDDGRKITMTSWDSNPFFTDSPSIFKEWEAIQAEGYDVKIQVYFGKTRGYGI